jgi:hypothetical protein
MLKLHQAARRPQISPRHDDPQREACYAWERDLILPNDPPAVVPVRKPFTFTTATWAAEFRAFHELTWRWAFERYGGGHRLVTANPPQLRSSARVRRSCGHASLSPGRNGYVRPVITFGRGGPMRKALLHEQAHLLTFTGGAFYARDGHGPRFGEIALALYVEFFGVDREAALEAARARGLAIAGSAASQAGAA